MAPLVALDSSQFLIIENFTIVKFSVDIRPNLNDYRSRHRYGGTAIK
jgi:hypothetical protein